MKKNEFRRESMFLPPLKKLLRMARLTLILLLAGLLQVAAKSYSQNAKLSLELHNATIAEILNRIEEQTDYRFFYDNSQVDLSKRLNFETDSKTIGEVLGQLFSGTRISYEISDRRILLMAMTGLPGVSQTRQGKITGKVTDASGTPLPGVTVVIKGTGSGTITDVDGNYFLSNVSSDAILMFSFVGMKAQEFTIAGKQQINVIMEEEAIGLDEVVAIGYGSVKKANLTTAISSIKQEAIENRPITSISEAFAGQLAGVTAQQKNGVPGEDLSIKIRGTNSINSGVSPLYIIDGIPTTTLQSINPNDIESIEVLKDASASAIYGARGSGGVVLIKSKAGTMDKPSISFNAYYGVQQREKIIDVMDRDEYIEWSTWGRNEKWVRAGGNIDDPNSVRTTQTLIPSDWSDPESVPNTNWQDEIYHLAPMQNYQLSASGGNEIATYQISGNYIKQDGILKESNFEMFSFRSNTDLKISDKIDVGLNIAPSFSTTNDPKANGKESVPHKATFMWPTLGLNTGTEELGYTEGFADYLINPIAILEETISQTKSIRVLSSIYLNAELMKNLHFKSSFGYDRREERYTYFITSNVNYGNPAEGEEDNTTNETYIFENTLHYNTTFREKHHLDALLGASIESQNYAYSGAEATEYPSDNIYTMNVATTPTNATSSRTEYSIASFFGRVQYDYLEKYLFSSTLRYDGCSRFGSDNRWGLFPSVSVGWKISSEDFMSNVSWINLLKLRMSWGKTGNNSIGDYGAIGSMSSSSYSFNGSIIGGYSPSSIDNPNLGWETTTTNTIGIDLSLFKNRIQLSMDGYINNTKDLLLDVPVPTTTGFESLLKNIGEVQNRGIELEVNARVFEKKDFSWISNFNISYNKNEVKELGEDDEPITITKNGAATNITTIEEAIGSFYLYETDGLLTSLDDEPHLSDQEVGNLKIVDQNGDKQITDKDRKIMGKANPDFVWGFQNSFRYKNFDFSFLFQGQWGADIFFFLARGSDNGEPHKNQRPRWINCYRSADQPGDGVTPYPFGNNPSYNDTWLYDASFIRLKNVNLGYSLPKSCLNSIGIDKLRLYFSIDNVFTHSDYPGVNPEGSSYGNDTTAPGLDYGTYPLARKYTFGINLTL